MFITVDKKGRATLPEEVRSQIGLKGGDLVILERTPRGTFELVPAAVVPKDQLWFHHPAIQRRVAEAELEVKHQKGSKADTPAQAEKFLSELAAGPTGKPRR